MYRGPEEVAELVAACALLDHGVRRVPLPQHENNSMKVLGTNGQFAKPCAQVSKASGHEVQHIAFLLHNAAHHH
jgi:hypothetical protein